MPTMKRFDIDDMDAQDVRIGGRYRESGTAISGPRDRMVNVTVDDMTRHTLRGSRHAGNGHVKGQ